MFANNEWIYPVLGVLALLLIVFTKGRLSYKAEDVPSSKVERPISDSRSSSE
jgi:hypothetical protein